MTLTQLIAYYSNLLIYQYSGLPHASGTIEACALPATMGQFADTVQTITFSGIPASGAFEFKYNGTPTASIAWNASNSTIQSAINAILPSFLSVITISGSLATQSLTLTFSNQSGVLALTTTANTLATSTPTAITISVSGNSEMQSLPLASQNGYGLTTAIGNQLDVIGKYVGVTRSGYGFTSAITLSDSDFRNLIQMAIIKNFAQSDLLSIHTLINQFFGLNILVIDYSNMHMSFVIASGAGSLNLIELFVTEGLLPVPMAVDYSVIYGGATEYFGYSTYNALNPLVEPFNTYSTYVTTWPWVSYANSVF